MIAASTPSPRKDFFLFLFFSPRGAEIMDGLLILLANRRSVQFLLPFFAPLSARSFSSTLSPPPPLPAPRQRIGDQFVPSSLLFFFVWTRDDRSCWLRIWFLYFFPSFFLLPTAATTAYVSLSSSSPSRAGSDRYRQAPVGSFPSDPLLPFFSFPSPFLLFKPVPFESVRHPSFFFPSLPCPLSPFSFADRRWNERGLPSSFSFP